MEIKIKKRTLLIAGAIILAGFLIISLFRMDILDNLIPINTSSINLWTIFLTGLLTGGLTCLAVQGGLLAASIAQREEEKLKNQTKQSGNALPILVFIAAKLVAYTALGFLLGQLGLLVQLSLKAQIIMQITVIVFMLGTALNILNVHPLFRYFVIQPPKFLTRLVRKQSKSQSLFAPGMLGALTVLIPCGTTQAMMALAIGSANPFLGASVLFAFVLGTSPLFFTLGYFATKLSESLHQKFMRFAAFTLIILAIFNLNNVLSLTGNTWTTGNILKIPDKAKRAEKITSDIAPLQNVTIKIKNNGYTPETLTVKAGSNVTFKIKNEGVYTCASALTIPYFNYQKVVQAGNTETIALKMPATPTQIPFMCSMGMYKGIINVI